jgi:integrase
MAVVKLTDPFIKRAKATNKRLEYWDVETPGLNLRVETSGGKAWSVQYRAGGRWRRFKIGDYPGVLLAEARKRARKVRARVADGKDPAAERAAQRTAETFGELARMYLERHAKGMRSLSEQERIINTELLPAWENRKIADITRRDVQDLVDRIADRPAPVMANRVFSWARKMFNFAIDRELIEANPCARIKAPGGKEAARQRVLSDDEIQRFWMALEAETTSTAASVFKLQLLTAQRPGEVQAMCWSQLDLTAGWWTIPGIVAKNGQSHRVPLTKSAIAILESLKPTRDSTNDLLFPSRVDQRKPTEHLKHAIKRVARRAGIVDVSRHDLRRTAATLMSGAGVSRFVVKRVLNHADKDITAVYDRHGYDAEKREAVERLARRARRLAGIMTCSEAPRVLTFPASVS